MNVNIEKVIYSCWGNCIRLSNEYLELFATLDFGPRIIKFNVLNKPNMFFEDVNKEIFMDVSSYKQYDDPAWYYYGGHRFWISPEIMPNTYYPDNKAVEYEEIENGVILKQNEQKQNGVTLSLTVTITGKKTVTVKHTVQNTGENPIELAPWAITSMDKGGTEIIDLNKTNTGFLPNTKFALWPYSKLDDERVSFSEDFITLKQNPEIKGAFKIGFNNESQKALYILNDCVFIKKFNYNAGGNYPDFGVCFETYVNEHFLELETIGELKVLKQGDIAEHVEYWELNNK